MSVMAAVFRIIVAVVVAATGLAGCSQAQDEPIIVHVPRPAEWLDWDVTTGANKVAGEAAEDFCEEGVLRRRRTYDDYIYPSPNPPTGRLPEYMIRTFVCGNGTRFQVIVFFDQ